MQIGDSLSQLASMLLTDGGDLLVIGYHHNVLHNLLQEILNSPLLTQSGMMKRYRSEKWADLSRLGFCRIRPRRPALSECWLPPGGGKC